MMISTKILMKAECFFSKARTLIKESILSAELTDAEFVPYVQPVYKADVIVGGEVLLRILKNGILHSPEKYLSAMESCDVINDVTCSLLSGVKSYFEGYAGALPNDFYLSFNICARQLNSPRVIKEVTDFNETFEDRIAVVLEIVERGTMDFDDFALESMQQLTASGVRFAIDDFGSGSSCLKYIEHAGFSTIKIDSCLTVINNGSLVYSTVLDAILMLSKNLGIDLIAEGVETEEQYQLLKQKGVLNFQGYLFSRPVSIEHFARQYL
ncbi:EAL domain-containing protein [Citrobacter arsenatis]|nr:EAL domain-containing protein [Citrobacter arsenatis]